MNNECKDCYYDGMCEDNIDNCEYFDSIYYDSCQDDDRNEFYKQWNEYINQY